MNEYLNSDEFGYKLLKVVVIGAWSAIGAIGTYMAIRTHHINKK